jgi:DNA-binding CsgD family transcriptional regulator
MAQVEVDELIAQYADGKKSDEIARQYGISASTVRTTLLRNGVTMRWDYK